MNKEQFIFLPEYSPYAKFAYGFPENAKIMELATRRLKINHTPVGADTAAAFPWMRTVAWDVDSGGGPTVVHRDPWDYTFANRYSYPIPIHEVRIYAGRNAAAVQPQGWDTDLQVKLSIPNRRQIVERWMPWKALNTDPDSYVDGYLNQWAWQLPAPYFLSRTSPFQLDYRYNANLIGPEQTDEEEMFYVTLHGWDVATGDTIDLVKPALSWAAAPATTNAYQSITFNDDRDHPMHDVFITHMGFGVGDAGNSGERWANVLEQVYIRPQPPEGPKWHHDEFYPIALLANQLGTYSANGNPAPCMIHRPVQPYVLQPNESLVVELVHQDFENEGYDYDVDIGVFGTQPGTLDLGSLEVPDEKPIEDHSLIRAIVRPIPEIKYVAVAPCKVWLWVNHKNMDETTNSPVGIRKLLEGQKLDDRDWDGRELPFDVRIPVELNRGECIIAITTSEALMSMSVEAL